MSDEDFADDERPANIFHDSSIRASGGSSISSVKQFVKSNRDLFLGIFIGLAMIEGFFLFYAYREMQVSEDLHGFDARQAQVKLEVDEQLLTILNCRRDK